MWQSQHLLFQFLAKVIYNEYVSRVCQKGNNVVNHGHGQIEADIYSTILLYLVEPYRKYCDLGVL